MIEIDGQRKSGSRSLVGPAGVSGPQFDPGPPYEANRLRVLGVQRQMFNAMGYVIGFDRAIEIVAGSGQIPPPERAHAEEIASLCPGDRIMTLIAEEVPGEFLAIVEAAALQPGEAETTEDRGIHASVKLAAKREGSLVELMRALGAVTLEGDKGGSEGDPDVEFERIAVGRRRHVGEQRKRSSKQGARFIEGRHRYRSGARHAVGLDGRLDHACLVVVRCQLRAGRFYVLVALDRDRLGDGPVELASTSRTDHLQGNRPELVVTEIVRVSLITDDPSTPEFVEIIDELGLIDPSSRDHQTDREGPTDHGRHLGKAPSAVSELAQSSAQRRPHRRGEDCLTFIRGDPGSESFDDEKWIAVGLPPESRRQFRINRVFGAYPGGERCSSGFVESVEWRDGHCMVVAQGVDESNERMMLWDLLPARCTDDERGRSLSGTDNETDQLNGLGVTPLQIVDDQQARAVGGEDGSAHSVEQPITLSRVARLARPRRLCVEEFGQETSELGPPDRVERVDVSSESIRSEQVDDGTPRQSARSLVRASRRHHVSLFSKAAAEFQCETGLSDSRFPGHQHEKRPPLPRGVPCLLELVPFEVTADESRFGERRQVLALGFVAVERQKLLVHSPNRLARRRLEVALKRLCVPVVGAQRRGSVAKREMRFHLNSNGRFVGRLQVDDALGMPDRGSVVVSPRSLFCQPHEGPIRLSSKFRSLVQDPVVITSRKEIARIEARSELEITGRHGIAEPQHVDLARPSRNPPHSLVVDLDELTDVGKGMTELVEQLSEVGASLTFVGVGPELERES